MKLRIKWFLHITVIATVLLCGCTVKQEPKEYPDYSSSSGFKVTNADSVNVENLEVLAKVWGYAKYHHPVFAGETLNIDYELFELLPRVAYVDRDERNAILLDWAKGLGKFKSAKKWLPKEITDKGYTSPSDTAWLGDTDLLGTKLSDLLRKMRYAHREKPSRYAVFTEYRTISFDAESGAWPFSSDTGYDLLTLFRLWNMAEYYFPSVNITNKKWADVLTEYISKFLKTGERANRTTAKLIAELSDSHSFMNPNPIHNGNYLPVGLGFVENKLIVTDNRKFLAPNEEPVFELGDEIVSIDGHSPDHFVELSRKYVASSNESALLRDATWVAVTFAKEVVPLVLMRDGRETKLDVATINKGEYSNRYKEWSDNHTYYSLLDNGSVGYLYPGRFKISDGAAIMEKFKDTKAIVIDMRCYPLEFMPFGFVGRYFVPDTVQHVTFTHAVGKLPGYFVEMSQSLGVPNSDYYKGKIVVLVNEQTQSQAEYTTMAFQAAPYCVVVGSQTAGADGNIVYIPLPRNIQTTFSGIGVYYPDGTNTQRAGVRIDHYVTPTIDGIRAGRDEVLERALEIINSNH